MTKTQKGNIKIVGFVKAKAEVLSRKTVLHIDVYFNKFSRNFGKFSRKKKQQKKRHKLAPESSGHSCN